MDIVLGRLEVDIVMILHQLVHQLVLVQSQTMMIKKPIA